MEFIITEGDETYLRGDGQWWKLSEGGMLWRKMLGEYADNMELEYSEFTKYWNEVLSIKPKEEK